MGKPQTVSSKTVNNKQQGRPFALSLVQRRPLFDVWWDASLAAGVSST